MKAICIAALGSVEEEVLGAIELCLWQTFGFAVTRLAPQPDPTYAFDPTRGQHSSILVLRNLVARLPSGATRLLGVTERDLYIPMLSFVFGQAQLNGSSAVVSLARLHQEFYGLPGNQMLLIGRAVKEAVHEVGHTFGITHCRHTTCPMSLSNTVAQVDAKGESLCMDCSIILEEHTQQIRTGKDVSHGAEERK